MAISTIDPTVALVVVDLQKGVVGRETVHPTGPVVELDAQPSDVLVTKRRWGAFHDTSQRGAHLPAPRGDGNDARGGGGARRAVRPGPSYSSPVIFRSSTCSSARSSSVSRANVCSATSPAASCARRSVRSP